MKLAFAKSALERPTLVLNRSWIAIHVTPVRRALGLLYGQVAVVVDVETLQTFGFDHWCSWDRPTSQSWIRTPSCSIPVPEVIQLLTYNKIPSCDAPFTRRNLFERDGYVCQYCGRAAAGDGLSIDHVTPRSRGGRTSWDNCVLACVTCNSSKADRSLHESGLRLRRQPRPPRWTPFLNLHPSDCPESWSKFTQSARQRSVEGR